MKRLVNNYNYSPTISVPAKGHVRLNDNKVRVSTNTSGFTNPRDLIARDIRELISLNKKCIRKWRPAMKSQGKYQKKIE